MSPRAAGHLARVAIQPAHRSRTFLSRSAFIYWPHESNDRPLSYLAADVLPLGASQIELRAAVGSSATIEQIRVFKETRSILLHLEPSVQKRVRLAAMAIENDLARDAMKTLRRTRDMIPTSHRQGGQFHSLQLLMGGGGSAESIYASGIRKALREVGIADAPMLPLPIPTDLIWPHGTNRLAQEAAFNRLSVAYGLSFLRADLDEHRFPSQLDHLARAEGSGERDRYRASTKDDC